MLNLMGGKFETVGTRERTIISISAGRKAIEELALDVLVPSLLEPMFFKYEMYYPWAQAKNAANCPVDEAFHQASFSVSVHSCCSSKDSHHFIFVYRAVCQTNLVSMVVMGRKILACLKSETKFSKTLVAISITINMAWKTPL